MPTAEKRNLAIAPTDKLKGAILLEVSTWMIPLFLMLSMFQAHADMTPCSSVTAKIVSMSRYINPSGASLFIYSNLRAGLRLGNTTLLLRFFHGLPKLHAAIDPKPFILDEPQVFTSKIREMVNQKGFDAMLARFEKSLEVLKKDVGMPVPMPKNEDGSVYFRSVNPLRAAEKSVWDLALHATAGDKGKAIDLMMLFVQDVVAEKNGIVEDLARNGLSHEGAEKKWEHIQSVRRTIAEINEHSHFNSAPDSAQSFSAPDGQSPPLELDHSYHFWSAAYLAKDLLERGVEPNMARYLAMLNGDSYEKVLYATSYSPIHNVYSKLKRTGIDSTLAHPFHHIAMHVRGAFFGSDQSAPLPTQQQTYDFVKKNMWNHYRAIAYGDFSPANAKYPEPGSNAGWNRAIKEIGREKFLLVLVSLGIALSGSWEKCWCENMSGLHYELRRVQEGQKFQSMGDFETEKECRMQLRLAAECSK